MRFPLDLWNHIFDFIAPGEHCDIPVRIKDKYMILIDNYEAKFKDIWFKNALCENPAAVYLLARFNIINSSRLCKNPNPEVIKILKCQNIARFNVEHTFNLSKFPHGFKFIIDNNMEIQPGVYSNLFKNPSAAAIKHIRQLINSDTPSLRYLEGNPAAREIIEQNPAFSSHFSSNPNDRILDQLFENQHFINWKMLSRNINPRATEFLSQNIDKIVWEALAEVETAAAINLIEKNIELLNDMAWEQLSQNSRAMHLIDKYNERVDVFMLAKNPGIFEINKQLLINKLFY